MLLEMSAGAPWVGEGDRGARGREERQCREQESSLASGKARAVDGVAMQVCREDLELEGIQGDYVCEAQVERREEGWGECIIVLANCVYPRRFIYTDVCDYFVLPYLRCWLSTLFLCTALIESVSSSSSRSLRAIRGPVDPRAASIEPLAASPMMQIHL